MNHRYLEASTSENGSEVRPGCSSEPSNPTRSLSIALVCPRFEPSFFGLEYAFPVMPGDKRSVSFGGGLPLLAALVPPQHSVTIIDENVEEIDFAFLQTFDVVGLTGMIVQRNRMRQILERLRGSGPIVCVGGPYVTVDEEFFAGQCNVVFIGEADTTWPDFLDQLAHGRPTHARYEQAEATSMSSLPCPRYDLVRTKHYMVANVQFSRGCPFLCEFCDIIVIFGRKPRVKHVDQVLRELDTLLAVGVTSVFFVDDNFIGNKAAAKALLKALIAWQEERGYPMHFSTESSINLADDAELLDLLSRANFGSVFIGIESPRSASLLETRKHQNVRGDAMEAKLDRVRDAGLIVQAGFIVGFDNDDERIFDEQFQFIQNTGIGAPFISVLSPIPSTPLYDRLRQEGRLRLDDALVWFEPKLMSRDQLAAGYHELIARAYEPASFFDRILDRQLSSEGFRASKSRAARRKRRNLPHQIQSAFGAFVMIWRLLRELSAHGQLSSVGRAYLRAWLKNGSGRSKALTLPEFLGLCARHWHCFRVSRQARSNWGVSGKRVGSRADGQGPLLIVADPVASAAKAG